MAPTTTATAQTSEARTRFPKSNRTIKDTFRTDLMKVELPTTTSYNPEAGLTFCDATIRNCLEDSDPDGAGYWYCEECRKYGQEEEEW